MIRLPSQNFNNRRPDNHDDADHFAPSKWLTGQGRCGRDPDDHIAHEQQANASRRQKHCWCGFPLVII